jgi:hypothetical protein
MIAEIRDNGQLDWSHSFVIECPIRSQMRVHKPPLPLCPELQATAPSSRPVPLSDPLPDGGLPEIETEQSAEPFATNDATGPGHVLLLTVDPPHYRFNA